MYLDLTCPLEMVAHELSRDDMGKVRAYISLNNLSDSPVARIEGTVYWMNTATGQRIAAPFVADRLEMRSQRPFRIQLSTGDCPGADGLEIGFERLGFRGAPDWAGGEEARVRIEMPLAPRGAELNRLLGAAGPDARNFPVRTSRYWICVCGRPNEPERAGCRRCGRQADDVLARYAQAKVRSGETPAVHARAAAAEIPAFLDGDRPDPRETALRALQGLRDQCRAQRATLIRRSLFLAALIAVCAGLALSMRWLSERSEIAKGVRPVQRAEQTDRDKP